MRVTRQVIRDITIKMGDGMAQYVDSDLGQGTATLDAYNLYCHTVAGLVGEGLSRLFTAGGLESERIFEQGSLVWPFCPAARDGPTTHTLGLANSMGLFLQKTNIIRDYLEDYADGRAFWPAEVWRTFSRTSELGEFARPTAHGAGILPGAYDARADPKGGAIVGKGCRTSGLACLNFLVGDALELVPDSLEYLGRLTTPEVFRFCAIPQVMAIATLEACFDNPRLFTGVVKIRKGLTARLLVDSATLDGVHYWFHALAQSMVARCPQDDPSRDMILRACGAVITITAPKANALSTRATALKVAAGVAAAAVASAAGAFSSD